MSGEESRPQPQRRKKLVLRKIADVGASGGQASSTSYTGPLPIVRPPPKPALASEPRNANDASSAGIGRRAPRARDLEGDAALVASAGARAAAAMTPPASSATAVATVRSPSLHDWNAARLSVEGGSRSSVAPTVATVSTQAAAVPGLAHGLARFSLDSKVLAVGGALAASMLFVALGVFLGVHSTRSATSLPSVLGADSVRPAAIDLQVGSAALAPPIAIEVPPASPQKADTMVLPTVTMAASQLPIVPPPKMRRAAGVPAPKPVEAAPGWNVPGTSAVNAGGSRDGVPGAVSTSEVPEIPAAPAVTVDPFVQAVREDIREDEARSKR